MLKIFITLFYFINISNTIILPDIGNMYSKTILFPLIGKQTIYTKIINENKAEIKLSGIINKCGYVEYIDNYEMKLSCELNKLFNLLQTEYSNPEYNLEKDKIIFKLKIKPLRFNKKIILNRIYHRS